MALTLRTSLIQWVVQSSFYSTSWLKIATRGILFTLIKSFRNIFKCNWYRSFTLIKSFGNIFKCNLCRSSEIISSFVSSKPFLYPLKTSENRKAFWCFQGVEKGRTWNKWVAVNLLSSQQCVASDHSFWFLTFLEHQ